MGQLATLLLAVAVLAPVSAGARAQGSAECRYLTSQINFYESRIDRAKQLGDKLWEARLEKFVDALEDQQKKKCPGHGDREKALAALQELLTLAAQGALSFFTLGAL